MDRDCCSDSCGNGSVVIATVRRMIDCSPLACLIIHLESGSITRKQYKFLLCNQIKIYNKISMFSCLIISKGQLLLGVSASTLL